MPFFVTQNKQWYLSSVQIPFGGAHHFFPCEGSNQRSTCGENHPNLWSAASGESVSIFIGFKTDSNAASGVSLCFSVALQHLDGIFSYVPSTVPSTKKKWPCQQHPELFVRLFLDVLALASSSAVGVPKLGSKAKVSRARLDMAWSFKGVAWPSGCVVAT